jgi:hypothetical protein
VIDVRLDDPNGPLLGRLAFSPTGGLQDFTTVRAALHNLSRTLRVHNLYLVFRGWRHIPRQHPTTAPATTLIRSIQRSRRSTNAFKVCVASSLVFDSFDSYRY